VIKDAIQTEGPEYVASTPAASMNEEHMKDAEQAQASAREQREAGATPSAERRLSLARTAGAPFRTAKVLSIAANCASLAVAGGPAHQGTEQRIKNTG
jgi:hypothetical protein